MQTLPAPLQISPLIPLEIVESRARVASLKSEAKAAFVELRAAETGLRLGRDRLLSHAWEFGRLLASLKDEIGHGKWMIWLPANFPELGKTESAAIDNAARCIRFWRENPNSGNSPNLTFSAESVRKFMWNYIPAKERPALPGDEHVSPGPHQLTVVNHFFKIDRQIQAGHLQPDFELMRRDYEPMLRRMVELLGRDYFEGLLG